MKILHRKIYNKQTALPTATTYMNIKKRKYQKSLFLMQNSINYILAGGEGMKTW